MDFSFSDISPARVYTTMRAELPVFSFLCTALLAFLLPIHYKHISIAHVSIISWLLVSNIIHGINSVVWADNTSIHVPVWCDIVTKVLLGANVALPAAFLCICRHMELLSSSRKMRYDQHSNRDRAVLEAALCILLPMVYVSLHTIVQDRRFDIVDHFGCEASIYPSAASIILIWLPPIFLCIVALVYACLALYHTILHHSDFSSHLETRTHLSVSHFITVLIASGTQLALLVALFIFSLSYTASLGLESWTSWSQVHSQFSHIVVTSNPSAQTEFTWWIVPALSIISASALAIDNFRSAYAFSAKHIRKEPISPHRLGLESWIDKSDLPKHSTYPTSPVTTPIVLNSSWDDTLDSKSSTYSMRPPAITTTSPPNPPHPYSTTPYSPELGSPEDDAFMMSTLSYLQSPTAQQAFSLPRAPPPTYTHVHRTSETPSAASAFSFVDGPWPLPPSTIPSSPNSPTHTVFAHPALSPAERPFSGPSVTPASAPTVVIAPPPSARAVRRQGSRTGLRGDRRPRFLPEDVIYMTVVKETV